VQRELPTGTVTFLFTDVEGSTKLLHDLGAGAYAEALAAHRRVIRQACVRHGGVEVDTQGDAFFVAFATAPAAVAAAAELTEALMSGPVFVRVGLHTGTPLLSDEGYVGVDVHRAARIAASGHGGQVLVSQATASLLNGELRDLGEHRFKDLLAAERVYQLGSRDFPPLRSLGRTNLPVAWPLLGRERELAEIRGLVADGVRLLTLTGTGGSGKTRLALQAAAELSDVFQDGTFFVPLAPLRETRAARSTVAEAVGLQADDDVAG
jgi:class 3 adenylate cyclase